MKRIVLALGIVALLIAKAHADELKVGSVAPDFTGLASDKTRIHLYGILDHAPIILFFYPKDDAPESAKDVRSFGDNFTAFHDLKATILGVGYDFLPSHQKLIQMYHLPFLLISDADHVISRAYGADGFFAAKMQTFVIDKTGTIVYINRFVDPTAQGLELQNLLAQL